MRLFPPHWAHLAFMFREALHKVLHPHDAAIDPFRRLYLPMPATFARLS